MQNRVPVRFTPSGYRRCVVCSVSMWRHDKSCCSDKCVQKLEDARDSVGWLQISNANLHEELHTIQEKLGRTQLALEKTERLRRRLSRVWCRLVVQTLFGAANRISRRARSAERKALYLHKRWKPLERAWRKLVRQVEHSDRELSEVYEILNKAL